MGTRKLVGQQVDEVLAYFGRRVKTARIGYRKYLVEGLDELNQMRETVFGKGEMLRALGMEKRRCCEDERILGNHNFAERVLPEESKSPSRPLNLEELIERVARDFSLQSDALNSRSRTRELSDARAIICYLAVSHLNISGAEVARRFDWTRSSVTRADRRGREMVAKKVGWIKAILQT